MPRRTSARGVELVKRWEGLRLLAYQCPAGIWTIGYGHTGDVKRGDRITEHQANAILTLDLESAERAVEELVTVELSDNEFAALVSFVFNLGRKRFAESTMLALLNRGRRRDKVAEEFPKWKHAAGRVVPGLVRRRMAERELFLSKE
jgi:lysozyme